MMLEMLAYALPVTPSNSLMVIPSSVFLSARLMALMVAGESGFICRHPKAKTHSPIGQQWSTRCLRYPNWRLLIIVWVKGDRAVAFVLRVGKWGERPSVHIVTISTWVSIRSTTDASLPPMCHMYLPRGVLGIFQS